VFAVTVQGISHLKSLQKVKCKIILDVSIFILHFALSRDAS
jgi:hypothetical protein